MACAIPAQSGTGCSITSSAASNFPVTRCSGTGGSSHGSAPAGNRPIFWCATASRNIRRWRCGRIMPPVRFTVFPCWVRSTCLCATAWSSPRTFICPRERRCPFPHCLSGHPTTKMTAHRPISVMCAAAMPWWCRMYADAMRAAANGCPIITRWRTETIRSPGLERRNGATEASACWVVHTSDIHSGARRLWATRI